MIVQCKLQQCARVSLRSTVVLCHISSRQASQQLHSRSYGLLSFTTRGRNSNLATGCSVGPLVAQQRWSSGGGGGAPLQEVPSASLEVSAEQIPPPPLHPILETVESAASLLSNDTAQSLEDLGLGGWSPSGLLQHCLNFLNSDFGIPWWGTIVIGTVVVKTLMFPLVVKAQKNAAHMNNHLPQMQILQMKMSEARKSGNQLETARAAHELMLFMKEKDVNPVKNMIIPFLQAPVFISFFFALRGMANLPMESLKTGGMFWFVDLTVPDPFYILPLLTSATLFFTIELGAEGGLRADNMQWTRHVFRAIPVVIFPFIMGFPSAILCYWTTSNAFSLCQVGLLRVEAVRKRLGMPKLIKHKRETLPLSKRSFMEGVKDSYTNAKITRDLEDRVRADEMRFKKAGLGPIVKTYPYDPTKQLAAHAKGAADNKSVKG
ncbi:mitochondrial inner membrane protein OXA1L-like [Ornithodoros turicata]